jgi:hypothetical protein
VTVIQGLRSYLLANASIAAIVGTKVYPLRLPQKVDLVPPSCAIVLTLVDDIGEAHLRGPNALSRARIQVDCWAKQYDDAVALASFCRQRIDGYSGTWTDTASPQEQIRVQAILSDSGSEFVEEEIQGGLYRQSTDYMVSYAPVGEAILI